MKVRAKAVWAVSASTFAPLASAGTRGITVTWEAIDAGIPTLGGWGLVVMALLLAVVGVRLLKSHGQAARFMSVALIAGGLLLGAQTARTLVLIGLPDIEGAACAGGSESYPPNSQLSLQNSCKNAVRIISYEYPDRVPACFELQDVCPVGTRLGPGGGTCDPVNYYSTDNCPVPD